MAIAKGYTKNGNDDEKEDVVNHPGHYTSGKYEVIEVIKDKMTASQFTGFLIGNIMKYIMRAPLKGNALQDCKKAKWYLDYLIEYLEGDIVKFPFTVE